MLDVRDMSEEDKLFNFLSGLQTWAQTELRRQGVKDLPSAISAADRLVDFRVTNNSDPEKKKKDSGKEKGKSGKPWKDGKFKKKKHQEVTGSGNKETVQSNFDRTKKGCYLCNGDHRMRDCPKRGKLNALWLRPMMMRVDPLGSILCSWEIQKLGLTLAQHSSRIKAVNSEAKPIQGSACVELKVGAWTGQCKLLAVPLDDFDVILGMDFMLLANAMDSVRSTEKKDSLMSAMQVKAGLRRGDQTYLAALIEIKPDVVQEVPDEVAELLQEFKDAPYRMAPAELAELRKQLDGLLEAGLVQPSKAPYGSPVLFQRKQDGSMRMCVDYRALNKVTIKNKYPIPNAIDLFDKLTKAKYYTKIDLRSGYWQVRVARGDEPKTTCVTRYGSFEFLVMPFGLTNAPATFCNLMNDVLYEYLDRFVVVYLDDIVIYSETLNEHVKHLRAVFQKLREYELYAKKEKCEFCCEKITFLGHVISQGQIQMDRKKVQAVMDWGIPSKMADLRSFLGLANYYRRFIKGYSKIVNPLTDLLRKDQKWEWTVACEDAFKLLKQAISSQPVLKLPQFDRPFEVQVDASDRALGGVLVQQTPCRKLKMQSYGTKFTVVTDNVANTYFKTQRKLSPKQARWQEFLGEFDFEWVHRPGKHNDVADALSRKLVEEYVAALTVVESDFLDQIRESSKTDVGYLKIVEQVKGGLIRKYWLDSGLLYAKGGRVFVPTGTLRRRLLRETHDPQWAGHPGIDRMIALLARRYYWPRMEEDVEAYVRTCLVCQLDKVERKKEAGLLQPLPIPEVPWQSVSMDFITGFPKVNGMASILVVVDRFSKYGIFIAAPHACPAETAAELFFKNVTKYFGVPKDIVSDRDARFTGRFWTALFNMMGTELKFSTANHPQTDGQTERVNALVEDYLRHYVSASQRNWVDLLDVAQFSYNLHKSSATGMSPFELAYGQQPTTPHEIAVQRTGGKCPAAYRYARSKQELLDEAKDSLAKAQRRMKKYADMGRRQVEFSVGDQDLLDAARRQTQRAPPVIRKEFEKTVLKILDHRTMGQSKKNRRTDYLVHWSGESEADATWERDVTLWQFEGKLDEYWAVRDGVTPTRASGSSGGVVCNPLLGWCPALVWQACAPGRRTVSAWGDTARHSQTDGRSGCQAAVGASRRAAHSGRTAWQTRALDSAACAQHSAVVRDTRQWSAAVRTDSAVVGSCAHGLGGSCVSAAVGSGALELGSGREHSAARAGTRQLRASTRAVMDGY
ncbi:UNVERIFIED_CONTAM: Transposon Tf2-12 polyprotein [Sesamum calycinum]|uniref:Transposon Tf2-12 polyprotein n=1 Tax=Sesamum calycinum TaxID=2727403 RepID=A0AAW2QK37_9LAMI